MLKTRWLLALPLLLATSITSAQAASVRDSAGMFSPEAVRQAQAKLDRIERESKVPILIETVESLPEAANLKPPEKRSLINDVATRRARESGQGVYLLISKDDHLISNVLTRKQLASRLPSNVRLNIRDAIAANFKKGDFDAGLNHAVDAFGRALAGGPVTGAVPGPGGVAGRPRGGTSGIGTLLMIGLGIVAVMFVLRLLGGLFGGAGRQGYGQGQMGGGPGQMGGPGWGGQGYGPQRGGGFMSSLFGGIGGAMAGNWLYDQFSGRHHGGTTDSSSYGAGGATGYDPGGDEIVGGNDDGGQGADWGGGGGGDWGGGGGDWGGGGDGGGGGDW